MDSLSREVAVIGLIITAQLLTQAALGQVISIIHVIADSLQVNDETQPWLIASYSLTVGTFILLSGRLGDVFGYKRMLIIGYVWFAVWSLISGLAVYSNSVLFIFSRALVGIGPSICLPNALALLGILYKPGPNKNMAFAIFGASAPVGFMLGATFSAIFALAWWPWTFFVTAIVASVVAVAATAIIPDQQKREVRSSYIACLDLIPAAIGISALVLINFAWNQAPIAGWRSPYIIVCLIVGVLLLPLFFFLEIRSSYPLIPLSDLSDSTVAFVLACVACGWGSFGIWIYYTWQMLLQIRFTSPLLGCAYLSPLAIVGIAAALVTGQLLGKIRPAWLMVIALSAFLTGNVLIQTLPPDQTYWAQIFVATIIIPWGMDMSFPAATIYLSNAMEKSEQGVAASLVNTVVNYSVSLALGIAGTVEVHVNGSGHVDATARLDGYRGALSLGVGLAGLGLLLSIIFLLKTYMNDPRRNQSQQDDLSHRIEGKRTVVSSLTANTTDM